MSASTPGKKPDTLFFERPCPAGWVYPCTVADLRERVAALDSEHVSGLWAVGLVPATRRHNSAYARYVCGERPVIEAFSCLEPLCWRQPAHTRLSDVRRLLAPELRYGMVAEPVGTRIECRWTPENLRKFVLEVALLHEIGHHVYHRERERCGLPCHSSHADMEQRAEAFAERYLRTRRSGWARRLLSASARCRAWTQRSTVHVREQTPDAIRLRACRSTIGVWPLLRVGKQACRVPRTQRRGEEANERQNGELSQTDDGTFRSRWLKGYREGIRQHLNRRHAIVIASPDANPVTEHLLHKLYNVRGTDVFGNIEEASFGGCAAVKRSPVPGLHPCPSEACCEQRWAERGPATGSSIGCC
ncbi:MAG: hypothetical protein FJX72_22070 [Armatimonadetes bacterium]|nr:hypothetical protein [Armatimonadota bacterium]